MDERILEYEEYYYKFIIDEEEDIYIDDITLEID